MQTIKSVWLTKHPEVDLFTLSIATNSNKYTGHAITLRDITYPSESLEKERTISLGLFDHEDLVTIHNIIHSHLESQ